MGCKECLGRWGLPIFTILFCTGVLLSTSSPEWIKTTKDPAFDSGGVSVVTFEYDFGPFYSRNRTCDPRNGCRDWNYNEVSQEDCDWVVNDINYDNAASLELLQDNSTSAKLCRQNTTWRAMAMICWIIVIVAGVLVLLACCIQGLTCGCCGGSVDFIVMILYSVEVACSIVAWSFTISTVYLLRDLEDTESAEFGWGFQLFIISGTILGLVCMTLSDWASEGSILKCLSDCCKCLVCCKK